MAGFERVISDESDSEIVGGPESNKRKDNVPSSYFVTEFNVSTKKSGDNHQGLKGSGRNYVEEPSTSDRKVSVNVSTHGLDKKTEIAVTSSFKTRKKVDSSTQSDRNIIGQEESPPKERRKWQRPPVVGQAANIDLPPVSANNHQTSSDSELEKKKTLILHLSLGKTTSYFDNYGVDKESLEFKSRDDVPTPDNFEQRVPSPASASSLTSRPLEWDSGADVGYNVFSSDPNDQRLSTIEKLALVQGTAIIFKRSDPEGTTGNHVPTPNSINLKISPPVAESTPKNPDHKSDSESGAPKKGRSRNEAAAPPLFPEVIIKTIQVASDGSISPDLPRRSESEGNNQESENLKKVSTSLEDMGLKNKEEKVKTVPRSNSHNNILEENNVKTQSQRFFDSAKSRSSSSVSTVVNKRGSERSQVYSRSKAYERARDSDNNENESNPVLPQHEDILSRHTSPQGTDQFNTLESNPLTGEARVNSFEYLPGHVYENSVAKVDSDSSSHHSNAIWDAVGTHSTLRDDVERGANLMAEFIRSSKASEDSVLKKQLVRRVVEKLINSEYPDDVSIKSTRSSRAPQGEDMRMEFRGQISGESSTEKSDINQLPIRANKCVGTGMSTSLSGYTETSDWNSAAESSRKSTSDYHPANFSSNKRSRKLDELTQINSRGDAKTDDLHLPRPDKRELTKSKVDKSKKKGSEEDMLKYLKKEKRNQLDWIKSEINHLSNLKQLLEKHEILKRNLGHLKRNQQTLKKPLQAYSDETRRRIKLKCEQREVKSTPAYLNKDGKFDSNDSASSCQKESGWTSHHYETEDELRVRKENIEPKMSAYRRKPTISISDPLPRSTSYTITFPNKSSVNMRRREGADDDILLSVGELKSAIDKIVERHRKPTPVPNILQPTLKECLESERPDYVKKVEARRQILSEIVELRQHRQTNKQEIIAAAHADLPGPPPPLAVKRVFSQKNLRKQTERKYRQLAEVRNKKAELKRKEEYRTNRLMADIFNKKLQKRTLQGQVNLSNSVCVTDPTK